MNEAVSGIQKLRIDKWLWAARFFKTRALASEAIARNRIKIGGSRVKASRPVVPGDVLVIEKPPYRFQVTIRELNDQRRPAAEAQALYEESAESIEARRELSGRLRLDREARIGMAGAGRPTKRQRRQIIRFQNVNDAKKASDE